MCGIAGIVGDIQYPRTEARVRKMTGALAQRGPDGEGIESWDEAVLGHRRLAIFDLSNAGRQPMVSPDGSIGVVFNGAIYNYRDLRSELKTEGYNFKSRTDTEVLIHGYQEWGIDRLVSKLRGMFAFGLWDNIRKKLFLVRDRLGVKPLIFTVRGGTLAFASTAAALRAAEYVDELDETAIIKFLTLGFITDDCSIYRGAIKVQAGSIVEWCATGISSHEYWRPPSSNGAATYRFKEAVEETERLFLESVALRLHADVPVGTLLSGGIDSSLVCWAVKRLGGDITAFTVAVPGDPWDEAKAARQTARVLGIQHKVLDMSDRQTLGMDEFLNAYSEPFACASALGMLRVSEAVAASAKVLLTGDGGDDVFLGYPVHRHLWLASKLAKKVPSSLKSAWLASRSSFPRMGPLRRAAALFDYTTGHLNAFFGPSGDWSIYQSEGLLGDRLKSSGGCDRAAATTRETNDQVLEDFLRRERQTRFVGEYLTKVDGATMHYGLEARSPFLDQRLWEFASSLPFDVRLHGARLKAILRELARRKIGEGLALRRKRGFGIPVHRWIANRWRPHVEAAFTESILDREGWICSDSVLAQVRAAASRDWAPQQLWYLFVLECWLKHQKTGSISLN